VFAYGTHARMPMEHMQELSASLFAELPWLEESKLAGIHPIYGAESGNGWERTNDPEELIYFSRRQKMTLRLPKEFLADAENLVGKTLNVAGYDLELGKTMVEDDFLQWAFDELKLLDITVNKMMAGKERVVKLQDNSERIIRSLMVAEMKQVESVRLQQHGLGEGRKLGCGLFMPQKDIKAVNSDD